MVIIRYCLLALLLLPSCATVSTYDGPQLNLRELRGEAPATVLFWWATQCPCVSRYQSRMEDLAKRYAPQGVKFFAISSNSDDDEAKIGRVAQDRNFALTLLKDPNGELAAQLGARTTPTVVIVNRKGEVAFRGWMDNERVLGDETRIAYAENALIDTLAGKEAAAPSSPIFGCRITKKLR